MKTYTTNPTTVIRRWTHILGAMLLIALMVPAIAFSLPLAPVLNLPGPGVVNVLTSPTFNWDAVAGTGITYHLQIATAIDFSAGIVYDDATLTGITNIITGLANSTVYYWRVSATDAVTGLGPFSIEPRSFTTQSSTPTIPPQLPVALGAAARFAILSTTGLTNIGATAITGDAGASPVTAISGITGFSTVNLTGTLYTVDNGPSDFAHTISTALLSQALGDLTTAYNDAAGRSLNPILVAGNLGGRTLYAGLYKSSSTLAISSGDLTLDGQGDENAVWIFQIASGFNMTDGRQVILSGLAKASNVFWQVGSLASFGSGCVMKGTIMAGTSCTFVTGATLVEGRALATNGNVTMQGNTITRPAIPAVFTNPTTIDLTTAANFRILAATAVTIGSGTTVTGDVGGPAVTNNGIVNGDIWVTTWSGTEPNGVRHAEGTTVSTALSNLGTAITTATGRSNDVPLLGPQLGGLTLGRGVYASNTGTYDITGTLILTGSASDIFIFQTGATGSTLNTAANSHVILTGGALASNVFWQVQTAASLGISSVFKGNILAGTDITQGATASLDGKALAHTGFVTVSGTTVLPVELVSFTATANRMNANLRWSTATEVNNYGFEIERRQTSTWAKVGFVSGAGTSNAPRDYSYSDINLPAGRYTYRLKQVDNNGAFSYHGSTEVEIGLAPQVFALSQNYPNPFNPSTVISYQLPVNSQVTLKVYDVLGKEVATLVNGRQEAGSYSVSFGINKGTLALSSGMYIYRLEAGSFVSTKKLVLMK